jgi:hypothetical protein
MIIFGCLLAFAAAFAPRVILILAWIFSNRWSVVWKGDWIVPLLGIILLPYTTIMYMLVVNPVSGAVVGWDWMWIFLGVLLDIWKWTAVAQNRKQIPGYPQSEPVPPTTMAPPPEAPSA